MQGIFIAIEGIDGAGKTTQVNKLCEALSDAGEQTLCSKEPTDGRWGRIIRESATRGRLPLTEELDAFVKDRKEHLEEKILPALERGEVVILDRYFYSTIAYQGARGADVGGLLREMLSFAPVPDIVFVIDLDPFTALSRISSSRGDIPNEFERQEQLSIVREIFLSLKDREEIVVIDGSRSEDDVYSEIVHALINRTLKEKRCAKNYDCDLFYCSYRINGACRWFELQGELRR